MTISKQGLHTICTHAGAIEDTQFKGAVSPLFMATSYAFEDVDVKRYPRYFNTPNQVGLCEKLAALEQAEAALVFGSGMAAVSTTLLAFLKAGDHIVLQKNLYGGTMNLILEEFHKFNISYDFTADLQIDSFEKLIKPNTKIIYIETPSNPLMTLTDIEAVAQLAKAHQIISVIDNTFASPVNQQPITLGIDVVIHSATKYLGGHSDILAGAVMSSQTHIDTIFHLGKNLGGNLSDFTVWLLDRSIKTLGLRVKQQNKNAKKIAKFLENHPMVAQVYYPGLPSHPDYLLAKKQMKGFGGMLSFELQPEFDTSVFQKSLRMIKSSMSLAGVESTILSPSKTSHALLSEAERTHQGIRDGLLRFSIGIENKEDIIADLTQAFEKISQ